MYDQYNGGDLAKASAELSIRQPNLREQVKFDLERAVAEVKRLQELEALLADNPATNRILELLGRR